MIAMLQIFLQTSVENVYLYRCSWLEVERRFHEENHLPIQMREGENLFDDPLKSATSNQNGKDRMRANIEAGPLKFNLANKIPHYMGRFK